MEHQKETQTTDPMEVWRSHCTVHALLTAHLTRELTAATGLSEADFQIVDVLLDAPDGRIRALDLRCALQWEKSRLSHQVRRMATRGLLERQECTIDGRGLDIVLTDAGREAATDARRVRQQSLQELVFDALEPDHIAALAKATAILAERVRPQTIASG